MNKTAIPPVSIGMRRNRWELRTVTLIRRYAVTASACTIYLYLNLFASPRFPFLLGGDQLFFWMGAQRLLAGQVMYRDFFQFTPPGVNLIYAACFAIFGAKIWVTNVVVPILGVLLGCLCFSLSRQLMRNTQAQLASGLFLVLIYGRFLNATHHWFAVLFILLAVRASMKRLTIARLVASGTLLALATFFNQIYGVAALLGFVLFLLLSRLRKHSQPMTLMRSASVLVLTFTLVFLGLYAYYLRTAGLNRVWFCLVQSVFRYVRLPGELKWSTAPTVLTYFIVYLVLLLVYSWVLWRYWRFRRNAHFSSNKAALLSLTGLSLLLVVAVSVNTLRLFAIAMPGIVLLVWIVGRMPFPKRQLFVGASVAVMVIGIYQIVEKHLVYSSQGEFPGGRLATTSQTFEKLRLLGRSTQPGDYLLQAGWPGVYLPLQVQSPLYMPTLSRWDSAQEEDIKPAIQQLDDKQVRYVLWTHHLDERCNFSACNDYLSPMRTYLMASFRPVHTFFDDDTLWERVEHPTHATERK